MALKPMARFIAVPTVLGKKVPSPLSISSDTRNGHCSDLAPNPMERRVNPTSEVRRTPTEPAPWHRGVVNTSREEQHHA
jgi:hypothetical protein